jgi:hypothetical protein
MERQLREFVAQRVPDLLLLHGKTLLHAWVDFKCALLAESMRLSSQHAEAGRQASAAAQQAQARLAQLQQDVEAGQEPHVQDTIQAARDLQEALHHDHQR